MSDIDSKLFQESSQGKTILFIAPIDQEFSSDTQRLMINNGEISTLSKNGEEGTAILGIEDITKQIRSGDWEIREAYKDNQKPKKVSYIEVITTSGDN